MVAEIMVTVPIINSAVSVFERAPWNRCGVGWLVGLVAFLADCVIEALVEHYTFFPILFLLPVMLMAWNCGRRWGAAISVGLIAARCGFELGWGFPVSMVDAVIDAVVRGIVLIILALVIAQLAAHTRMLRARVQQLEGILPICMHCKKIRDEQQTWQQLEAYIGARSDAQFSHGICPECVREHYSDRSWTKP
jgi:K+-sensing histidine kinase KdpD